MELSYDSGRATFEVRVRADPAATVGELAEALQAPVPLEIDGVATEAGVPLARAGLRDGSTLTAAGAVTAGRAVAASDAPEKGGWMLEWVSGPRCQPLTALPVGRWTVSTDPDADIVADDPAFGFAPLIVDVRADATLWCERDGRSSAVSSGDLALLGRHRVRFVMPTGDDRSLAARGGGSGGGNLAFRRPPRDLPVSTAVAVEVGPDDPSTLTTTATFGALAALVALAGAIVAAVIFDSALPLVFAAVAALATLGTYVETRRRSRRERRWHHGRIRQQQLTFEAAVSAHMAACETALRQRHASPSELMRRANSRSVRLWERRPTHPDFMTLAVGWGNVAHSPELTQPSRRVDLLEIIERHQMLHDVPVELTLEPGTVLGICGASRDRLDLARHLVLQAIVHHGPADVRLVVAAQRPDAWDWAKWIPHCREQGDRRFLARDEPELDDVVAWIAAAPSERTTLVVVDGPDLVTERSSLVRRLLDGRFGPACAIVLAEQRDSLPSICTAVLEPDDECDDEAGRYRLVRPDRRAVIGAIVPTGVGDLAARAAARAIARFSDPEALDATAALPADVRLTDLLGPITVDDPEQLAARWRSDQAATARRLTFPLGVSTDGIVTIDLVRDGPHALVAGTTGSGKSELLRSLVAGIAASAGPDDVTFLLVDYKGGSAFDACAGLPHVVGLLTDLDEHLGARALRSLEAELRQRERVLRDAQVGDIAAYRRLVGVAPLPRLVVVIDEFATLHQELPDFIGALIGVAQRGRSLGIHLVLATQRPAGVVNDDIRANTNLRIALRVQDAADATDVIGSADAARISPATPGRAYVRSGPTEPVLVQTARVTTARARSAARVSVTPFRFESSPSRPVTADAADLSDLDALVTAAGLAHRRSALPPPRRPWMPPLPASLSLDELSDGVALVDDPDRQQQLTMRWDHRTNLVIYGARGAGVTTALTAVVVDLARTFGPDEVSLYVVDMGAGELAGLGALDAIGAAITAGDHERQLRLLRLLESELERRQADPECRRPALVVVIDDVSALITAVGEGPEHDAAAMLARLVAHGPEVAITFALSADRVGALPRALADRCPTVWLMRPNDRSDYSLLGVAATALPRFVPGRAIDLVTKKELQFADPGPVERWVKEANAHWSTGRVAAPIGAVAERIDLASLPRGSACDSDWLLPIGIRSTDLRPAELVWGPGEHVLVAGPARSGRSSTLVTIVTQLRRTGTGRRIYAVVPRRSPLRERTDLFDRVTADLDSVADALDPGAVLVVDDAELVDDDLGLLARYLVQGDDQVRLLAAARHDAARSAYSHWLRTVRQSRRAILLWPDIDLDGELAGLRLPRHPVANVPGRGYLASDGEATLIQVAQARD